MRGPCRRALHRAALRVEEGEAPLDQAGEPGKVVIDFIVLCSYPGYMN